MDGVGEDQPGGGVEDAGGEELRDPALGPALDPAVDLGPDGLDVGAEIARHQGSAEVLHERVEERRQELDARAAPEPVGDGEAHGVVGGAVREAAVEGVQRREQPALVQREAQRLA